MKKNDYQRAIEHLSISEGGVFTTAQAQRCGIPRDALAYASSIGRIERLCHGAYRLTSMVDDGYDELRAVWKLTAPTAFAHERMGTGWDGIAVSGASAACLHGIGDLFPRPYQFSVSSRFNSRKRYATFKRAAVPSCDVTWKSWLPVTKIEVTLRDLLDGGEDLSLVADAFLDAVKKYGATELDIRKVADELGDEGFAELKAAAGIDEGGTFELVNVDGRGHVALRERGRGL